MDATAAARAAGTAPELTARTLTGTPAEPAAAEPAIEEVEEEEGLLMSMRGHNTTNAMSTRPACCVGATIVDEQHSQSQHSQRTDCLRAQQQGRGLSSQCSPVMVPPRRWQSKQVCSYVIVVHCPLSLPSAPTDWSASPASTAAQRSTEDTRYIDAHCSMAEGRAVLCSNSVKPLPSL